MENFKNIFFKYSNKKYFLFLAFVFITYTNIKSQFSTYPVNFGFESIDANVTNTPTSLSVNLAKTSGFRSGSKCAALDFGTAGDGWVWFHFSALAGYSYKIEGWEKYGYYDSGSFDVYVGDTKTIAAMQTVGNGSGGTGTLLYTSTVRNTSYFNFVSTNWVCPVSNNYYFAIKFRRNSVTRATIDDITITEIAPSCTPASQSSSLSVTGTTSTTATLTWTNGGGNGTIVIARPVATSPTTPANGTSYLTGLPATSAYGTTQISTSSNYVVYKGSGTSTTVTGLSPSTTYSFDIYSYTSGTDDCYNVTSVPTTNASTTFCDIPGTKASAITFSGVSATGFTINWTNSGSGNPVLVVLKPSFWPTYAPEIGTSYSTSTSYGDPTTQIYNGNYAVYSGTGTSVTVSGLHSGVTYTAMIYEFAGTSCYNLSSTTSNQTTTFAGTIYYVDDNSNTGDIYTPTAVGNNANNGLTAATPKATLKNLLTTYAGTLKNGDIIYIDAGTYTTEISISITTAGLSLIGAGKDLTFIDRSASTAVATDWFLHINTDNIIVKDMTIMGYENNGTQGSVYESGQAITVGGDNTFDNSIYFENVVFYANGQSGGNAALDILKNSSVFVKGGGSLCNVWETAYTGGLGVMGNNIGLSVQEYILAFNFKSNSYDGAGIRIEGNTTTNVHLKNVNIAKNKGVNGGGVALVNGNLLVEDCVFDDNYITQVSDPVYGSGLFISCGNARITRSKFINNATSTSGKGGAIAVNYNNAGIYSGSPNVVLVVDSCVFENNTPSASKDFYVDGQTGHTADVVIRDCQFLTGGNYNIVNDDPTYVTISATYFGTAPTNSGTVTKTLSSNTLYTPNPTVPSFTGVCGSIVLPVELSNFNVLCQNTSVKVDFETSSERQSDYFIIEKASTDAVFTEIAHITASGTSSEIKKYSFTDYYPLAGTSYYRLKQVDYNGKVTLLDTKVLNKSCSNLNETTCYYNSFSNSFELSANFENNEDYIVTVYDALGKLITDNSIKGENNLSHISVNLPEKISGGVYFIKIKSTNFNESIKTLKY